MKYRKKIIYEKDIKNGWKICSKCHIKYNLDNYRMKSNHQLFQAQCNDCKRIRTQNYRKNNREKVKANGRKYIKETRHKPKFKERIKAEKHKHYLKYKKEILQKKLIYDNKRRKTDIHFRLRGVLSSRLRKAMKNNGTKKSKKTIELIGCSIIFLKSYLESKFKYGMNWENYGIYGWHIDHIIPCSSFNLAIEKEQKRCFHYTNLQPLWAKDNLSKSNKLT